MGKQLNLFGHQSLDEYKSEKTHLSWDAIDNLVNQIVDQYQNEDIEVIVGLSRGGLCLGVSLSNRMNIPLTPLEWQTRDGDVRDVYKLTEILNEFDIEKILFVDDICDSGKTINQIRELAPASRWATLVNKIPGEVEFSPIVTNDESWITFPWE
tara:strand:- start:1440 stop:1901 length:462 start_codon:yes stop_codon:yes gene_type:complete